VYVTEQCIWGFGMCAACLYNITRPDSQFLCTRVYILCDFLWPEVLMTVKRM